MIYQNNWSYKIPVEVTSETLFYSFMDAIRFASEGQFDAFIALGGGSVIDTCKVANLYSTNVDADFFDYVDPPIGRGMPVTHKLKPLIASMLWPYTHYPIISDVCMRRLCGECQRHHLYSKSPAADATDTETATV